MTSTKMTRNWGQQINIGLGTPTLFLTAACPGRLRPGGSLLG